MKASKKLVEKQEKEKTKVKSTFYYKKVIKSLDSEIIEKMKKVVRIIHEEIKLYNFHGCEPPYLVKIDEDKIKKTGLILSDAEKIIELFTTFSYFVLPQLPPPSEKDGWISKLMVNLPIQNWNIATQDWNFEYPYEQNFENFYKVITGTDGKNTKKRTEDTRTNVLIFDEDRAFLKIYNSIIKFSKFSDQYDVLRIIFKNNETKNKDWQLSEIAELMDWVKDFRWKRLYNTIDAMKKKIAIETGIKDFFITTTQSVKINDKYLKKS